MTSNIVDAAASGDARLTLAALRDILAAELEPTEHRPGCECDCGPPANDGSKMAALAREMRAVLADIDKLPGGEVVTELDRIAARAGAGVDELAERRAHRRAAGADPPGA
jgi:hypothetical protein